MKKINHIIALAFLAILTTACDLNITPTDAVDSELVFQNVDGAEKVLNGTWAYLMDTYFTYANPGLTTALRASDAMGNDVAIVTTKYGFAAHYQFNAVNQTNNTTTRAVWTLAYKGIDNCNHVLAKVDAVAGEAEVKERVKAQAYALRGYLYLNLITFYQLPYLKDSTALSIPIYTTPSTSTTQGKGRSPVGKVYEQIVNDLNKAYATIGDYNRGDKKYKIDKQVVAGLLARTYLQKGAWKQAQDYAHEAITGYSFMDQANYTAGFNNIANAEWIWGHAQLPSQSTASYNFHFLDVSSSGSYYYSFMADPYFKDLFDPTDIRYQLFEWDTQRHKGGLMYKKFKFRSDLTADIVLMRKAEMVLIEAEALAEQNKLAEAIVKLNELRIARGAGTPDLSSLSKDNLVEEILIERRKELFGEGFSLSDILRRQKAVVRKAVPTGEYVLVNGEKLMIQGHTTTKLPKGDFVPNSPYYIFSIPELETTNNNNL